MTISIPELLKWQVRSG